MGGGWLKAWEWLPDVVRRLGYTPSGGLRHLKRVNRHLDGKLLRKVGERWQVRCQALLEYQEKEEKTCDIDGILARVESLELKLIALRNAHRKLARTRPNATESDQKSTHSCARDV